MSKQSKVMALAAMALALGNLPGMAGEFHTHATPPTPKDPNDSRVARAEAKRQRKAAKRATDLVKQQLGRVTAHD